MHVKRNILELRKYFTVFFNRFGSFFKQTQHSQNWNAVVTTGLCLCLQTVGTHPKHLLHVLAFFVNVSVNWPFSDIRLVTEKDCEHLHVYSIFIFVA